MRYSKKSIAGWALSLLLVAGMQAMAGRAMGEVTVQKEVSYLGADRAEKMDIYTPSGKHDSPMAAVLIIHGGGWTGGDKADGRGISISTDIAGQGYVVFAINYKLAVTSGTPEQKKGGFPQNVYDCKSALRYIRANAAQYHVDPKRIGILGESAGGHLVLLLGSTQHLDALNRGGLYTDQSNAVTCVIDMYGVYDIASHGPAIPMAFRGNSAKETEENIKLGNPMEHIDAKMPPTLILHGTADPMVPIQQSEDLAAKLKQLGVPYEFVKVPEGKHSFNLHPKEEDLRPVVFSFLKKYLAEPSVTR